MVLLEILKYTDKSKFTKEKAALLAKMQELRKSLPLQREELERENFTRLKIIKKRTAR